MEPKELEIKSEREKVIESLRLLKDDLMNCPSSFFSEHDLQRRLYYHLCEKFQSGFNRIHLEYTHPDFQYDIDEYLAKQKECRIKYVPKNIRDKIIPIKKKGKYDLAILDKKNQELLHVIELKKITSCSDANYHKGYEDIYLLTDRLDKKCQSYFFIFAVGNKKEMEEYIRYVDQTYKKSNKVYFDYYI